jgi:hypothetical protein
MHIAVVHAPILVEDETRLRKIRKTVLQYIQRLFLNVQVNPCLSDYRVSTEVDTSTVRVIPTPSNFMLSEPCCR